MLNPNCLLRKSSPTGLPKIEEKTTYKGPKIAKPHRQSAGTAVPRRTGDHASRHSRTSRLVDCAGFLSRVHDRASLLHDRVVCCFPLLCFPWCSGLPQTSNLPWNHSWNLPFYRNSRISPEKKIKHILGTIESKEGNLTLTQLDLT